MSRSFYRPDKLEHVRDAKDSEEERLWGSKKSPASKPAGVPKPVAKGRLYKWRWPIIAVLYLVIAVLVFIASLIPLFNILKIDDAIRNLLVFHIGTKVENKFDDRLETILISENQQPEGPFGQIDPSHRPFYSEMLQALSAAKARMIILDMEFAKEAKDKKIDQDFAQAVAQLQGTEVLVAADLDRGQTVPILAPLLEPVLKDHWGIWDGGKAKGTDNVRFVRLGIENPGQEQGFGERAITPSLALHTVATINYPGKDVKAFFDPFLLEVHLREGGPNGQLLARFPVNTELYFLVDLVGQDEMGRHPSFYEVYSQRGNPNYMRTFNNKVVIIGYEKGDQKQTGSGTRFGADIQASAMSNLLQKAFIHPLDLRYHFLVILIMVIVGGILRIKFNKLLQGTLPLKVPGFIDWKPQVPVALIVVSLLYIFIAIMAYLAGRTIFSISYHIAALFLAYLLTSALCSKLGFE